MATKFRFDEKTGTMVTVEPEKKEETVKVETLDKPENASGDNIVGEASQPNIDNEEEAQVLFKKFSDLSIMRVDDQDTGKWLCYFSGYALDIRFNMEELKGNNATKKMEACLEGLNKLFRKIILDQALEDN